LFRIPATKLRWFLKEVFPGNKLDNVFLAVL
jgi:hypothetical protein